MARDEFVGLYQNATGYYRDMKRRYKTQLKEHLYDNESELIFADWAEDNFTEVKRITEADVSDGGTRPDFVVRRTRSTPEVLVEVKRLEDSRQEQVRKQEEENKTGVTLVRGRTGGDGIRKKIRRARKQFRPEVAGGRACVVMLMDDTRFHRGYIDEREVMSAMYGRHVVYSTGESHFGDGRTTTQKHNRQLSAIATLAITPKPGELFRVRIYHNIYAEVPVTPEQFYPKDGAHFVPWSPGVPAQLINPTAQSLKEATNTAEMVLRKNEELKRRNEVMPPTKWIFYVDRAVVIGTDHLLHTESCSYRLRGDAEVQVGLHGSFQEALAHARTRYPSWRIERCEHCSAARN